MPASTRAPAARAGDLAHASGIGLHAAAFQPMDHPSRSYSCPVVDQPSPAAGSTPTVFIATPMYGGMATGTYTWSLAQTPAVFLQSGVGLLYQYRMNDALVANARNNLADDFLGTPATHLMWIDADIGFNAVDIVSMILADQDIICGMYPLKAIHWGAGRPSCQRRRPSRGAEKPCGNFLGERT